MQMVMTTVKPDIKKLEQAANGEYDALRLEQGEIEGEVSKPN